MSVIELETRICAVCGTESKQLVAYSASSFRPAGLDLKSDIRTHIQSCPNCNYLSHDIAEDGGETVEYLSSEEFLSIGAGMSNNAREHLRYANLLERKAEYESALRQCLEAAWSCEDSIEISLSFYNRLKKMSDSKPESMRDIYQDELNVYLNNMAQSHKDSLECRRKALSLIDDHKLDEQNDKIILIKVDLLRRCELFEEAEKLIAEMPIPQDSTGMMIWNYQRYLIRSKDSKEHDVQEAETSALRAGL